MTSKRLGVILYFDLNIAAQATVAATVAGLCLINPPLAAGAATGLSMAIINREMRQASIAKDNAKKITTLRKQNEELCTIHKKLKADAEKLENELNICLDIPERLEQIVQTQALVSATIEAADQKTDEQMEKLRTKMQKLASLCQCAVSNKHLLERMKTAKQVETDLTKMTLECSARQQELTNLNRDIHELKTQLQEVLSSLSSQDEQLREKLIGVNQWLKGIQC